jgi:hypothetical protein
MSLPATASTPAWRTPSQSSSTPRLCAPRWLPGTSSRLRVRWCHSARRIALTVWRPRSSRCPIEGGRPGASRSGLLVHGSSQSPVCQASAAAILLEQGILGDPPRVVHCLSWPPRRRPRLELPPQYRQKPSPIPGQPPHVFAPSKHVAAVNLPSFSECGLAPALPHGLIVSWTSTTTRRTR